MIKTELEKLLTPVIQDLGYELWGCDYFSQGRHSLLRIYIDGPEGIGIADCERVSKQVSAFMDVEDPLPGQYSLEISSPGIPRPLFAPWQYQRYLGSDVQIKLFKALAGKRKLSGTIISVTDQAVTLETEHERQEILFSNIVKANVTVERGER